MWHGMARRPAYREKKDAGGRPSISDGKETLDQEDGCAEISPGFQWIGCSVLCALGSNHHPGALVDTQGRVLQCRGVALEPATLAPESKDGTSRSTSVAGVRGSYTRSICEMGGSNNTTFPHPAAESACGRLRPTNWGKPLLGGLGGGGRIHVQVSIGQIQECASPGGCPEMTTKTMLFLHMAGQSSRAGWAIPEQSPSNAVDISLFLRFPVRLARVRFLSDCSS